MKTLFTILFVVSATCSAQAQDKVIEQVEFDRVFKASYNIFTVWSGQAFRKKVSVEFRSSATSYQLDQLFEFDGRGATRAVYNEHVQGQAPRLTREIIGVGNTHYLRDVGNSNWWTRSVGKREELDSHRAYVPDPDETQAVRSHFVRTLFDTTVKDVAFLFAGTDRIKDQPVNIYKRTEQITGVEKKTGLQMETGSVMKYSFGPDGIMLRSESVSTGRIGNEEFFLRIVAEWEPDRSITIVVPELKSQQRCL